MLSPDSILTWLKENVNNVRLSRLKTLAAIVPAAMERCGVGVLALGRSMEGTTSAKHNIKRVGRFLGNKDLECEAIAEGLFNAFAPKTGRVLVLADWTDVANGKMLVFTLPCNGRSIPFFVKVVPKQAGDGALVHAEEEALQALGRICRGRSDVVLVADRGFGNKRWLSDARHAGFHFVQRLSNVFNVDTEKHIGSLRELNLRRGRRIRDWGCGTVGDEEAIEGRLVTTYDPKAREPWYLVTDLHEISPEEVVSIYRRRWWIETCFRDKKNRDWGLGLDVVVLKDYRRYERLFYIAALAFIFLTAHGAVAEATGFADTLKANTRKVRVLNLMRTGYHFIKRHGPHMKDALRELRVLATAQRAPNWG